MGGAASSFPDQLTEEELRNICGDRFDQAVYDSLKDDKGFVDKSKFLEASGLVTEPDESNVQDVEAAPSESAPVLAEAPGHESAQSNMVCGDHEKEAEAVFKAYCHSGDMDSKTFIKLCKDIKLLNKQFSSGDADLVYQKAKKKNGSIKYQTFRNEILVDIAAKKGCDVNSLVNKIAASDGPVIRATATDNVRFHDDKSTYTGAVAKNTNFKNDITQAGDDEHTAALKVQSVQRVKIAKKQVEELKEIKATASSSELKVTISEPSHESEDEVKLKELFLKFCPTGEMDSRTFIKLCRDCGVVNKTYTSGDADLAFQKTKAAASHPSAGSYSSGVVHGKRVNYEVFRAIAIPCIAEKKKIEVSALVAALAKKEGPILNGVTATDTVRFHDDKSTYTGSHAEPAAS